MDIYLIGDYKLMENALCVNVLEINKVGEKMIKKVPAIDFYKIPLVVTNHAVEQWKVRVDESLPDNIGEAILHTPPKHLTENFYEIENHIILVAFVSGGKIIIPTIYGSRLRIPALNNFKVYLQNRKKYGKLNLK